MTDTKDTDDTNGSDKLVFKVDIDNVIQFPSLAEMRDSGGPVTRAPRNISSECRHGSHGVTVYEYARRVVCKRCSKDVDAFDALLQLTLGWDWEHTRLAKKLAHEEVEVLGKDIERLKKERAKVKRTGSVTVHAVQVVFRALREALKRQSASYRSHGGKAESEALDSFIHSIDCAKVDLLDGRISDEKPAAGRTL